MCGCLINKTSYSHQAHCSNCVLEFFLIAIYTSVHKTSMLSSLWDSYLEVLMSVVGSIQVQNLLDKGPVSYSFSTWPEFSSPISDKKTFEDIVVERRSHQVHFFKIRFHPLLSFVSVALLLIILKVELIIRCSCSDWFGILHFICSETYIGWIKGRVLSYHVPWRIPSLEQTAWLLL